MALGVVVVVTRTRPRSRDHPTCDPPGLRSERAPTQSRSRFDPTAVSLAPIRGPAHTHVRARFHPTCDRTHTHLRSHSHPTSKSHSKSGVPVTHCPRET
jgi:hypothetical protein